MPDAIKITRDEGNAGDAWHFVATVRGEYVGTADCVDKGNGRLLIGDLKVAEKPLPMAILQRLRLAMMLRPRPRCRGQGFGAAILDAVLSAAKSAGFREIYGTITKDDLERQPFLTKFYGRRGFELTEPDGECAGDPAYKIMKLI